MKILDGKGRGQAAAVNSDHRLLTSTVTAGKLLHNSLDGGEAFMTTTNVMTVTSTAEHSLIYINNPTSENFMFSDFWLSYNGGSTTWNKTCTIRFRGGTITAPSANSTLSGFGNLNTGSANTAGITVYVWDGVSTGMTHASNGQVAGCVIVPKGSTYFKFEGFVLAPGQTVIMTAECEEIGKVGITLNGFFDHNLEE